MAARNPQMIGAASVWGGEQERERREKRTDWPYTHLFPPPGSTPINQITQTPVLVPAIGATAVALSYRVPSGRRLWLTGVVQNVFGAAVAPGDITWTIDVNTPVGIADSQKMPVQGLTNIPVALGSFAFGVIWRFEMPYEFDPLDLLQSKATNVASGGVGPGNTLVSAFLGFLVPVVGMR